jgi:hypothetical protein
VASTTIKIVWLSWSLFDMGVPLSKQTPMNCDNKSVIQIIHKSVFHEHTKHKEINYHLKLGTITLSFILSSLEVVDLFMKTHSLK